MTPLLELHGVRVVAISSDTAEKARLHIQRDSLPFKVLADPTGKALRTYGLEIRHLRWVTVWQKVLPIGIPVEFIRVAIPTTVLIDEGGIVRWIDPATDYRVRSDEDHIRAAFTEAFGQA